MPLRIQLCNNSASIPLFCFTADESDPDQIKETKELLGNTVCLGALFNG